MYACRFKQAPCGVNLSTIPRRNLELDFGESSLTVNLDWRLEEGGTCEIFIKRLPQGQSLKEVGRNSIDALRGERIRLLFKGYHWGQVRILGRLMVLFIPDSHLSENSDYGSYDGAERRKRLN